MNEGTHRAVVIEAVLGMTSTGKEQVAVSLERVEDGQPTGDRIAWYGTFTDAAMPFTVKSLRTMGWKGDDLSDLSSVIGGEVDIVCAHEEYNGQSKLKVKFINAPGSGGALVKEQLAPDAAKAFAKRMMGQIRAADVVAGAPRNNGAPKGRSAPKSKGVQSPEPPYDNTDDIPF